MDRAIVRTLSRAHHEFDPPCHREKGTMNDQNVKLLVAGTDGGC
jgi:hypothetical protein